MQLVGDLDYATPFLDYKATLGVEHSIGINSQAKKPIPTTSVSKVAINVIKTITVDPRQQTWSDLYDPPEDKTVPKPVPPQTPEIDLRFFLDGVTDVHETTKMLNNLLGGKATAYALREDVIKRKNIKVPEKVRLIVITNKKL